MWYLSLGEATKLMICFDLNQFPNHSDFLVIIR